MEAPVNQEFLNAFVDLVISGNIVKVSSFSFLCGSSPRLTSYAVAQSSIFNNKTQISQYHACDALWTSISHFGVAGSR